MPVYDNNGNLLINASAPVTATCLVGTAVALGVKNIKASPGSVYGLLVANKASTIIYLQFYNTAGTPTLGTGVVWWVPIAVGATLAVPPTIFAMGSFSTGIGIGAATSAIGSGIPAVAPDVLIWYV